MDKSYSRRSVRNNRVLIINIKVGRATDKIIPCDNLSYLFQFRESQRQT